MAVLLIADVNEGQLATDQVAKALAAVAALGEVHVLVAGTGGDGAAAEAATLAGVTKVLFAEDHAYCHGMAESTAALVVGLAGAVQGGRQVRRPDTKLARQAAQLIQAGQNGVNARLQHGRFQGQQVFVTKGPNLGQKSR